MSNSGIDDGTKPDSEQLLEIDRLRSRLQEAEEALEAIRSGEVDALVVSSSAGDQIFTLQGADYPYRVMVEAMNEGAATLLRDGTILYANPRLAGILGEPLETLIGSTIQNFIPDEDSQVFMALTEQGFSKSSRAEIHFRRKDLTSIPVFISVSPTQVEGAQALCLVATDLTEQKHSEEIMAAERLARSILEQAADAILVCDTDGKIIRANQKALQTFSQNPIYKHFKDALPLIYKNPDGNGKSFSIITVLNGDSFHEVEAEFQSGEGENRYFLLSAAPLLKEPEQIIGCIVSLTEMTERKRLEERLVVQARLLEQSNNELQDFTSIASHDLQEPLRKIASFGDLLATRLNLEGTDLDYLQRMQDAAQRMQKMIDSLLDLSRVSSRAVLYKPVDLNEVAKRVVDDLELRLAQSQGQIILHSLPIIDADELQMQQLLQNLVGNALKYHQPGIPPVVEIGSVKKLPDWVEIYVKDNGIGFEMQYFEEIFKPFHRLHGRSEYEGSGIGLSICKKIVERHRGRITAYSVVGKGSTFYAILPVKQVIK